MPRVRQRFSLLLLTLSLATCIAACNPSSPTGTVGGGGGAAKPTIGVLPPNAPRPNVLIVLVDTLRADKLGAYGHTGGLMPTADGLAKEGLVFERAQAVAPWTLPSVGSLFTGFYPSVHKAISYEEVRDQRKGLKMRVPTIASEFVMLAEVLRDAGYRTAAVSANPFVQDWVGYGQGFETFKGDEYADNTASGAKVNADVSSWLDQYDKQKPFFMYVHYMDVHGPYDADPKFMEPALKRVEQMPNKRTLTQMEKQRFIPYLMVPPHVSDASLHDRLKDYYEYWVARYEAGVQEADSYVGALFDDLKRRGLWDNTLVIFTADHGEAFLEHDFWDHGYTLYQEELHIPLFFYWPKAIPAGRRVKDTVRNLDIYPTILQQLRLPVPPGLQGVSLVDIMSGNSPNTPLVAFAETTKTAGMRKNNPQQAVVIGDWKLVQSTRLAQDASGKFVPILTVNELYNLADDPGEKKNLADANKQKVDELSKAIVEQNAQNAVAKPGVKTSHGTADAGKLKSLGYAGDSPDDGHDHAASQPTSAATKPTATASSSQPSSSTIPNGSEKQ